MSNEKFRLMGIKWSSDHVLLNNRLLFGKQNFLLLFAEVSLAFICTIGDYYIFDSIKVIELVHRYLGFSERLTRALMDNCAHSSVGILSWLIIAYPNCSFLELALAGFFASILDLDHFINAKSLSLQDAISLGSRPFMHNTLHMLVANIVLYFLVDFLWPEKLKFCWLLFIAWFSHHVRDANRRGLWFGSLYTTQPLDDSCYLGIILILPVILRVIFKFLASRGLSSSSSYQLPIYKDTVHIV